VNDPQSVTSATIPVRVVPVDQVSADLPIRIPADETVPRASEGEAHNAADLSVSASGPPDLDSVLASLRSPDSVQAFSEVAEPGPGIDASDGADADGD
jgi:hypothetical protein